MENVNKVIKIGDLVALKTHPDFKGVVQSLYKRDNFNKAVLFAGCVGISDNQYYANISILDDNYKETMKEFKITLLKVIETY